MTVIHHDRRKPVKTQDRVFQVINYTLFALFALICVYPFYYLIINSISANDLSASGLVNWVPKGIHFKNYQEVLKLNGIGLAAFVSLARTVIGTACTVLASAYLGFMFTQQKMWHRKLWYRLTIITMYFNAGLIPMFMTMKTLHLTNNFLVYIIPAIVQPFNIIMVKTYVESIPASLQEAAEIDGANKWNQITNITIPCLKPVIIIMLIMSIGKIFNADFGLFYQVPQNSGALYSTTSTINTYVFNMMKSGSANSCLLYTSPSPRDGRRSRMPSSA